MKNPQMLGPAEPHGLAHHGGSVAFAARSFKHSTSSCVSRRVGSIPTVLGSDLRLFNTFRLCDFVTFLQSSESAAGRQW